MTTTITENCLRCDHNPCVCAASYDDAEEKRIKATKAKKIEITMSERRPLKIDPEQWPIIAQAYRHDGQVAWEADTEWQIRVREHRDGRRLVYGSKQAGNGGQYAGFRGVRAGYLVDMVSTGDVMRQPTDGGPLVSTKSDDDGTVRAIRRVGGVIDDDQLANECIGDLPAEEV